MALVDSIRNGDFGQFSKIEVHKETFDPNFIIDEHGNFPIIYAAQMGQYYIFYFKHL